MKLLKAYRNLKTQLVNSLGVTESEARKRILTQIRAHKFDKRHCCSISKITKNTGIRKHSSNSDLYAAVKIGAKRHVFNNNSWVTKQTAIKRAKRLQANIDSGFSKV